MLPDSEITIEQAAAILDTTPEEVERLIKRSLLPSRLHITPDGKRYRLIEKEACRRLIDSGYMLIGRGEDASGEAQPGASPQLSARAKHTGAKPTTESGSTTTLSSTDSAAEQTASHSGAISSSALEGDDKWEGRLLALHREVAALAARVTVIEERWETMQELIRDVSALSERVNHLSELLKATDELARSVQRLEETHQHELQHALEECSRGIHHLQETVALLNHQIGSLHEIVRAHDQRLATVEEWMKEAEEKRPLAQVKKFIAERKGKGGN